MAKAVYNHTEGTDTYNYIRYSKYSGAGRTSGNGFFAYFDEIKVNADTWWHNISESGYNSWGTMNDVRFPSTLTTIPAGVYFVSTKNDGCYKHLYSLDFLLDKILN